MPRQKQSTERFLLWIDAVGGYLVCPGDEVVLGQAIPTARIEVPIFGDLSTRHAAIRREGEGYVLVAMAPVIVNQRPVRSLCMLKDGDDIQLGDSVRLQFRRPHALSMTARLDFVSRHKTQPSGDGVLLMADSCVLGPKSRSHVICKDWTDEVVLFRQEKKLQCRVRGDVEIDGRRRKQGGPITKNSHVAGEDFSFSLEEI